MKKIIIKSVLAISCFSLCLISCGKEEIPYFDSQYNAVRFNSTNEYDAETDIFKGNYSFLENPFDEYGEYELPLVLLFLLNYLRESLQQLFHNCFRGQWFPPH